MKADLINLTDYPWQLFATFTLRTERISTRKQTAMFRAVVRMQARYWGVHFDSIRYVVRRELGEINGRLHFHVLFAGLPHGALTVQNNFRIMHSWECVGGGWARVRAYDSTVDGVGYVLKGVVDSLGFSPRDDYELRKFGGQTDTTLSLRLQRELVLRFGVKSGIDVPPTGSTNRGSSFPGAVAAAAAIL